LLLLVLLAQAITGLFNSDELIYSGPLFHLLDSRWTDQLGAWHERLFWLLCGLVSLHVLAVIYYQRFKRRDIFWPMLHGGSDGIRAPRSGWFALALLLAIVGALALALALVPEPVPIW
jgi:cytochrome b